MARKGSGIVSAEDLEDYKKFITMMNDLDEAQQMKVMKRLFQGERTLRAKENKEQEAAQVKTQREVDKLAQKNAAERVAEETAQKLRIAKEQHNAEMFHLTEYMNEKTKAEEALASAIQHNDIKGIKDKQKELKKADKQLKTAEYKEEAAKKAQRNNDNYETLGDSLKKAFYDEQAKWKNPGQAIKQDADKLLRKSLDKLTSAIKDGMNAINQAIKTYATFQTSINTRLEGVSSFAKATEKLSGVAFSPLVKAENLYSNLSALVEEGVVTNVEQRAFFMTIKDSIATTFDANSATLRRLIRVQQDDSTAARLGLESYLNRFLNEYVQNTEYLTSKFDSVADSLLETSALMTSRDATQLEFIVQKWLGTLTGVGLSDAAVSAISSALGQLGSGDIDSLSGSGANNLVIMAASRSGLSYADMLTNGIDALDANKLMLGMVSYLQEIGTYSSNVVKNQLAKTFGVTISDLVAAQNLDAEELNTIYQNAMSYDDMYKELTYQFSKVPERQGLTNILENLFSNYTYQTGMNIAANPMLYTTWKITDLIQGVTGGINIPYITALGNGIGLETTVENLIKIGIIGASTLGAIGDITNGLKSIGDGSLLLSMAGVNSGNTAVSRGSGLNAYTIDGVSGMRRRTTGSSSSSVSYVGNGNGSDYSESAINEEKGKYSDELQAAKDEAAAEQSNEDPVVTFLSGGDGEKGLYDYLNNIDTNITTMAGGITISNLSLTSKFGETGLLTGFYTGASSDESVTSGKEGAGANNV